MSMLMDLNASTSLTECPSIDLDEDDQPINLNYLENYFDSLLNQLESELSYLPESSYFVSNLNNSNNSSNHGSCNGTGDNIISDGNITSSNHDSLVNNHESFNHHFNHHHLHTINSTINSHDETDHINHYSTINNASNQQFKGGNQIVSTQSSSSSTSTSTTTTKTTTNPASAHSYSSTLSSTKSFNQRESPLSFSNYSRSSFYENNDEISYNLLTASQIQRVIDCYKPLMHTGNNNGDSMETKLDRKSKKTNGSSNTNNLNYNNNLFGCDVNNIEKAYGGLTLPPFIENALIYLARYGINSVGIFRKSGVKSRIMALRQKLESMTGSKKEATLGSTPVTTPSPTSGNKKFTDPLNNNNNASPLKGRSATLPRHYNANNFGPTGIGSGSSTINYRLSSSYAAGDDFCVYDVADMVKMWLREIKPRPLITKEVIKAYKELMMVNNFTHNNNNNVNNNNNDNDNNNLPNGPSPVELSLRLTVLLSDSQRAILEIFLHFLSLFAANSEVNQMNSQNLAICFTPSLCECDNLTGDFIGGPGIVNNNLPNNNNLVSNNNLNVHQVNGLPFGSPSEPNFTLNGSNSPRSADTEIIFDAQRCLQYLIDNCSSISMISLSALPFSTVAPTLSTPTLNATKYEKSSSSSSLPMKNGENSGDSDHPMDCSLSISDEQPCQQNNSSYTVNHLNPLMSSLSLSNDVNYNNHSKNSNSNNHNVNTNGFLHPSPSNSSLINGGNLLPATYESSIIINAAPIDILKRILYQKNLFDPTVVEWRIIKQSPGENSDVFEYKVQSSFFLPLKTFTIDRRWSFIENQPFHETSSPSPSKSFYSSLKRSKPNKATFKGIVLRETGYLYDSWWRIGTHGEGKCQLDISIAVDLRGHSYYWYTNTFPAIIDWQLYQIKQSFLVDFIETKNYKSTTV